MDKEKVVYVRNGVLLSQKDEILSFVKTRWTKGIMLAVIIQEGTSFDVKV
jgi:hypothetical protein